MEYKFKNKNIEESFNEKKEYYLLGFNSIDYNITKIVYNYLVLYKSNIEFCCDFNLVQRIIKKILSKEYFKTIFSDSEKYIYSYIGALIYDGSNNIESIICDMYKVEDFLLRIFKKENNRYIRVKKFIEKNNYSLSTMITPSNLISCSVEVKELNMIFTSDGNSLLESKYNVFSEIYNYILEKKLDFNPKDIVKDFSLNDAFEKLNKLYIEGFINEPNYFYLEHNDYEEVKYEVRCSIKGYNFFAVKIHYDKDVAKNQAAYSMLEMIVMQSN